MSRPNGAVRRFAAVWTLSTVGKLAALGLFLLLAVRLTSGGGL